MIERTVDNVCHPGPPNGGLLQVDWDRLHHQCLRLPQCWWPLNSNHVCMRLHRQMRARRHSPLRGLLVELWRLHHRCLRDGGRWRNSRGGGATLGGIVSVAEMGHPWQIATVAEVGSPLSGSVLPDIRAQLQDGAASLQDVRWSAVVRDATLNRCGLRCEGTRVGSSPAELRS